MKLGTLRTSADATSPTLMFQDPREQIDLFGVHRIDHLTVEPGEFHGVSSYPRFCRASRFSSLGQVRETLLGLRPL